MTAPLPRTDTRKRFASKVVHVRRDDVLLARWTVHCGAIVARKNLHAVKAPCSPHDAAGARDMDLLLSPLAWSRTVSSRTRLTRE